MNTTAFIKSFSKGQITIPKKIREAVGLGEDFWLKVTVDQGKIIAEPVKSEGNSQEYLQRLLSIKGEWFSESELAENRQEIEKRLKKLHGQSSS